MDRDALKQKIKEDASKIKSDLQGRLDSIDWKEKRKRVRAFFKKTGKAFYKEFQKLPKKVRRGVIAAIVVAGVLTPKMIQKYYNAQRKEFRTEKQIKEDQTYNDNIRQELKKKYVISDRQSFDELYEAALPLVQMSLFCVECCAIDPYDVDGKSGLNTAAIGLCYYPENGNPESRKWIKTSTYIERYGAAKETVESALRKVDGWYRCLDGGAVCDQMYRLLQGSELTVHEFAAIASLRYQSKRRGMELCDFVKKNYQNPILCAQKIVSYSAPQGFPGDSKRRMHEACLYLNEDNYVQQMHQFRTKFIKFRYGGNGYSAPVMNIKPKDVLVLKNAILSGDLVAIQEEQRKILEASLIGVSIADVIEKEVSDAAYKNSLLKYCFKESETMDLQTAIDMTNNVSLETEKKQGEKSSKIAISLIGQHRRGGR